MTTAATLRLGAGTPPTVPAGEGALYFDESDDQLYIIDAAGNPIGPVGGGGGGTPTFQDVYDQNAPTVVVSEPLGGGLFLDNPSTTDKAVPLTLRTFSQTGGDALNVAVTAGGTGVGIAVSMGASTTEPAIKVSAGAGGTGPGLSILHTTNDGIAVSKPLSSCVVNGDAVTVTGPSGQTALGDGTVSSARVIFNDGTSRVEIIGDPGTGGHYNPRIRLTSGPVDIGAVARSSAVLVDAGGAAVDLTLNTSYPTFIELVPNGAGVIVTLPSSADYPRGTQITLINLDGVRSISLASPVGPAPTFGPTVSSILSPVGGVVPPVTVPANTGIQLVARLAGWTVTNTF